MTRDLDTHWKLHWVLVSRYGLGIWMSFITWIRRPIGMSVIVTLGRSALHTKQGLCRVTYARGWMIMCVEFRDEILLRGGGGGGGGRM